MWSSVAATPLEQIEGDGDLDGVVLEWLREQSVGSVELPEQGVAVGVEPAGGAGRVALGLDVREDGVPQFRARGGEVAEVVLTNSSACSTS